MTTAENRAKALAHVGIAFAICFCIGPPIGAYFSTRPLPDSANIFRTEVNIYAVPALLTLVLLSLETLFLIVALPETRGKGKITKTETKKSDEQAKPRIKRSIPERIALLKSLRYVHFLFLGVFSGVEFTLTFLTFDCKFWISSKYDPNSTIPQCLIGITNKTECSSDRSVS